MKSLLGLILGILCLPLFTGCAESAFASQEDFTPKWSALAAAQTLAVDPATPVTPIKPGICSNCNGKGKVGDGTIMVTCAVCGGDGRIEGSVATSSCNNLLCDCNPCKCLVCTCESKDWIAASVKAADKPVSQVYPTVPAPVLQVCPTLPKKAAATAATGHWQTVQSCGRGGCSVQQVWVPHAPAKAPQAYAAPVSQGSCANGSCGTGRRGLFGRRR